MKKILLILVLILLLPSLCWSQGQITRPKKTESTKNETPKRTPKTNQILSKSTLPNSTETINGITVHWNGVTRNQKSVITNLLNNMVYVQGGSFMMGSNDSDSYSYGNPYMNEEPVHHERVSSFLIDKYEVTQKLWQAVMGNNPSHFKGENLPVEEVSWNDCQDFIKKLNRLTGLIFRLPTEVEWEYAARGGNKSNGYKYSGSNNIDKVGWYEGNSGSKTHSVGSKTPNELGIFDMSGNVEEWTSDKYSSNYNSPRNSSRYVFRGGNCYFSSMSARVTSRNHFDPPYRSSGLGFRLVL